MSAALPWETTHHATIPCYEGVPGGEDAIHAPPGEVLEVCIIADRAFLTLRTYDEDHKTTTVTTVSEAHVDAMALLNALVAQMGIERVQLAIPYIAGGAR